MPTAIADLIRADHREFKRLFGEFDDHAKRPLSAPVLVALLAAHARAEEAHVYPALRAHTDAEDAVEHSQEEHVEADQLAMRLMEHDLEDSAFDDLLANLVKAVTHHLEEEEETVLPKLDQLSEENQRALAHAWLEERAHHLCSGVIDLTKAELAQQAKNEGLENVSSMSKSDLEQAVQSSSD